MAEKVQFLSVIVAIWGVLGVINVLTLCALTRDLQNLTDQIRLLQVQINSLSNNHDQVSNSQSCPCEDRNDL